MKNYNITVNGNVYQVAVEEVSGASVQPVAPAPVATPAPVVAPVATPAPVATVAPVPVATPAGAEGAVKVSAPMPGKILDIKVNVGDSVKKGSVVVILEAMKMENEIVAPNDGIVASINVSKNESVESGDIIATLN